MAQHSEPGGAPAVDRRLIDALTTLASRAAAAILAVAPADLARRDKPDRSPVTAADEAAQAVILEGLARLLPGVPVISEEAATHAPPPAGAFFVLVDPLDGTRELIANTGEYAVNIALIGNGRPVAGVMAAPALETAWTGIVGQGAERLRLAPGADVAAARERIAIRTRPRPQQGALALISRFHHDPQTEAFLGRIPDVRREVCGSSIKFGRIAEGAADLHVRMTSISEWDVAAGHAIVAAAGGSVTATDGSPLTYGRAGFRMPPFIVSGDGAAANFI